MKQILALSVLVASCGGSHLGSVGSPTAITIDISPATATIAVGETLQLTATVANARDTSVLWSVSDSGSITGAGLYTAPDTAGTYHVVARANADARVSATATITVTDTPVESVAVTVSPDSVSLSGGGAQAFTADVTGTSDTGVTWSVSEATGCGSIDGTGNYTAPASVAASTVCHVVATSTADTGKSATATVTISPAGVVTVAVSPSTATLTAGAKQTFTATVSGTSNGAVTWSVVEASCGSVNSTGQYTAPASVASATTCTVKATSVADTTKSATATVTVNPVVVAITVTVSPAAKTLNAGGAQVFTAVVTGTTNTAVSWSIDEATGCGTIDASTGSYSAPATLSADTTCHVRATSAADGTVSGYAIVTLTTAVISAKESWIWPYNTNMGWPPEVVAMDAHATSFTHLSPTFYTLNYQTTYTSGVPYYVTCPVVSGTYNCTANGTNNFGKFASLTGASASYNGQTITTKTFTDWAHSRGFKVAPAIYGGGGNGGTDTSIQAILCGGSTAGCTAQTNLITALVTELVANNYDGYNFDWETSGTGHSYAAAFVSMSNALKSALVAAGRGDALVTVDAIAGNVHGSTCSGNNGWLDYSLVMSSSIDRVIIEDYVSNYQTAGWTPPTTCSTPLVNFYGPAVLSSSSPAYCDWSFTGMLIMMCPPNLDFDKAVIGLAPSVTYSNPIAGQAMAGLAAYGFTKLAVWPQYDDNANQFMSTKGIVPAGADWYTLLKNFLGN